MTVLYDHQTLLQLAHEGGTVSASGTYTVWAWAREGSHVNIRIGHESLPPTHTRGRNVRLMWEKAGEVRLEARRRFDIDIRTLRGMERSQEIGCLALSDDPGFDPKRSFDLTRVSPDLPGPVQDARVRSFRYTDMHFPFPEYPDRDAWLRHAEELRRHILVSMGLWPTPERCLLNAQVFGRIEREGYAVEKVYFESWPGFFVTGNLYRPLGRTGPFPGIACPHGHWGHGRLENTDAGSIPGRCISFARQGYVAFAHDMIGYNDSMQATHQYGGPVEELWGLSLMGLQLWNSIRSVDFLCSLDDVDPDRIGCTGASGGGTQTFMLTAVDDRIKVAAPVCMISAHFQGGCLCENGPNLRLDMSNVEIGAMMAPRPLLLVSVTGDWTVNTPSVEYPAIRTIYRLFDAEEKIHTVQFDAGHNYNKDAREAVYAWFGRWLLGSTDPAHLREQPFEVESEEQMRVFHGTKPPSDLDEDGFTRMLIDRSKSQLDALTPTNAEEFGRFRELMRPALQHTLAAEIPETSDLTVQEMGITCGDTFTVERALIGRQGAGDRIPALMFLPNSEGARSTGVLLVHSAGKAAFVDMEKGLPGPLLRGLLEQGRTVLTIDPFLTGEFHAPFGRTDRERDIRYFTTFNRTDPALRVQDILTGLAYLKSRPEASGMYLVGLGTAGLWALLACGLTDEIERTAVDLTGFHETDDHAWLRDLPVPGLRHAGGLRTAAILTAPAPLFLHNTVGHFRSAEIAAAYRATGSEDTLLVREDPADEKEVLTWLNA